MAAEILVDSNVFIDLLKARKDPAAVIGNWAGTRDLVTCGMVRVEVLRGLKSPALYDGMSRFMDVMIQAPTHADFWNAASELAWKLDRMGKVIPGTDVIIATCALSLNCAILTSDNHFTGFEGLEVITPPKDWWS
ncbi:MAG: PIN domain-containing protein [Luteolibacter sp.]